MELTGDWRSWLQPEPAYRLLLDASCTFLSSFSFGSPRPHQSSATTDGTCARVDLSPKALSVAWCLSLSLFLSVCCLCCLLVALATFVLFDNIDRFLLFLLLLRYVTRRHCSDGARVLPSSSCRPSCACWLKRPMYGFFSPSPSLSFCSSSFSSLSAKL